MLEVKKGDMVYIASSDRRINDFTSTVKSVGKKWITIDNGNYKFSQDTHICEQWGVYTIFKNKEESDNYKRKREHLNYICLNQYKLKYVLTDEEIENIYNKLKDYDTGKSR
jgi:hypothetical protein